MMGAIEIQELSRAFDGREVLRQINLSVRPGERVALLGVNGSGKTTLLRILATLTSPTRGDALVAGRSVTREPRAVRGRIGWVPASDGGFLPRLTGRENLAFFGSLCGMSSTEVLSRLADWERIAPLQAALTTPYYLCSAGMKQSLAICRAVLRGPDVLLLDEPTRSLDPDTAEEIRRMILKSVRGVTLLFSTHSFDEAASLGTVTLKLQGGRLG